MKVRFVMGVVVMLLLVMSGARATEVVVVETPPREGGSEFYVGNRPPLRPQPLVKLPIGAIEPRSWLRTQLERMADGFVGRLTEISRFLEKEDNAWLSPTGAGEHGWEEVPYWLKGFGDLGYVLDDERIEQETQVWIEGVLGSQQENGYFGPRDNLTRIDGTPDLWPNMIMLNVLQSYYEHTTDSRVLKLMEDYFRWEMQVPEGDFLRPFWQQQRAADNLASVYWLYNRTGEAWLLELAEKIHRNTANWTDGVANWHGVNIAQAFRGPANYYVQSRDPGHLDATERNYRQVMELYGQVPGGMFGADEVCRPGYTGPRQAAETCTMVEFMLSFEMLLKITGDTVWADRCEEVAYNSLPAALTADFKALRYLTAPNMPLSDAESKAPGIMNSGPMYLMDPHRHRCCQHNVAHGWPYFAEHLWMATRDGGLAAVLYAPSAVQAKVGDGTHVTIEVDTDYPFRETLTFKVSTPKEVTFPLYLRVPGWCDVPEVTVNGESAALTSRSGRYVRIRRAWQAGDRVTLRLPMKVDVRRWTCSQDSVSIQRGPLWYALKIDEEYRRAGGTDEWPAWEIHPISPWNYGLVLDEDQPADEIEVVESSKSLPDQPFAADVETVQLRMRGRRIPEWRLDHNGLISKLQPSPAYTEEPVERLTLIPMGAARIRLAAFPTVSDAPTAHHWVAPQPPAPAEASHCFSGDTLAALSDGLVPEHSNDQSIPRFTWWDRRSTTEWVSYRFESPREVGRVAVYWFDDGPQGGCRVPASWRLLYRAGDIWRPVAGATEYATREDQFNVVTFEPVTTTGLRIEVVLQDGYSSGILEWQVSGVESESREMMHAFNASHEYPIRPVPFTEVEVDDAFWTPRLETNRKVTVRHVFAQCEETGRIDNFAKAAGMLEGDYEGYSFNDSDVFKAVEGAAYALALDDDPELKRYLDGVIEKIAAAQEDDGYLYAERTVHADNPSERAGPTRWSHLAHSHELYNLGHLFEAAVAHYRATGERSLFDVALEAADLVVDVFGPDGLRDVPGHQEIEIGLARLYRVTGNRRYLELAKFFLDERGHAHGRELYGQYAQDHKPVLEQDHPVGHAVRAVYMYCGMADVAALTGDPGYVRAIDRIWQNMVGKRLYVTGGIGARHGGESFGDDYELPNAEAYCESCASIANVFWNQRMFLMHGDAKYVDVLERALYNGLLAGIGMSGDRFFYVNPLESHGQHERKPWFNCACCPTNAVRFMPSLPGYIYAQREDAVYVNLFIGSQAKLDVGGQPVTLRQQTKYPWEGDVRIEVQPQQPAAFALRVRVPGWARGVPVPGSLYRFADDVDVQPSVTVNGDPVLLDLKDGYVELRRTWQAGDHVTLAWPMAIRRIHAHPAVEADRNRVALQRGPLVYCVEGIDHQGFARDLFVPTDVELTAEQRDNLLGGVVVLTGTARQVQFNDGRPAGGQAAQITAIPYYAWNHRASGDMFVWLPRTAAAAQPRPESTPASLAEPSASHVNDQLRALHDQLLPEHSRDGSIPRFTWWNHVGTGEWVQYDFAERTTVSQSGVYWFDDRPHGDCRVPASWRLLYRDGEDWRPVRHVGTYPTRRDEMNEVSFEPVRTTGLRLEVKLQDECSGGILEWSVR